MELGLVKIEQLDKQIALLPIKAMTQNPSETKLACMA